MTKQNTSHAVVAQRAEARDSLDDFPTPPWATRALIEHILDDKTSLASMVCIEPACGVGHMAKVLSEYFGEVRSSDIHAYGYGESAIFLQRRSRLTLAIGSSPTRRFVSASNSYCDL
jgi:hypothetical protein